MTAACAFRRVDLRNFGRESCFFISFARRCRRPFVFLDTEFPGTIHRSAGDKPYALLSPAERYALLKANVDHLRPIQIGITLCSDADDGDEYSPFIMTWQFDLCDFDVRRHPQAPESVALLKSCGVDLDRTRRLGVHSTCVARLLIDAGLLGRGSAATWVAFQGGYDFAILMRAVLQLMVVMPPMPWMMMMMPRAALPPTLEEFLALTRCLFGGGDIYDIKCLMRSFCCCCCCDGGGKRLHGGLKRVAEQLKVERTAGMAHQAGSDSLLTCHVFLRMRQLYFSHYHHRHHHHAGSDDHRQQVPLPCQGLLFGLEA